MAVSRVSYFEYSCDGEGCDVVRRGQSPDIRRKDGKHWCLEHYPYDICANPRCARRMRPSGSPAYAWPGTVAKGSATRCTTCHKHYELYGTERKPGDRWTNIKGEGFRQ